MARAGKVLCGLPERAGVRAARLSCSTLALVLAALVLATAATTSVFALLTMRDGSSVPGAPAIFGLTATSVILVALCSASLARVRAQTLGLWVVLAVVACFLALAATPYARSTTILGFGPSAASLPLTLGLALVAVLVLTRVSAWLAKSSACSCS